MAAFEQVRPNKIHTERSNFKSIIKYLPLLFLSVSF